MTRLYTYASLSPRPGGLYQLTSVFTSSEDPGHITRICARASLLAVLFWTDADDPDTARERAKQMLETVHPELVQYSSDHRDPPKTLVPGEPLEFSGPKKG